MHALCTWLKVITNNIEWEIDKGKKFVVASRIIRK